MRRCAIAIMMLEIEVEEKHSTDKKYVECDWNNESTLKRRTFLFLAALKYSKVSSFCVHTISTSMINSIFDPYGLGTFVRPSIIIH